MFQERVLSQINTENRFFEVNFQSDLMVLKNSIQRIGILQPVLLRKNQIISGFRRLHCAKDLGLKTVPVLNIESNLSDVECFERAIEENLFSRSFNLVEKALILQKLKNQFQISQDVIIEKYMLWIGLEPSATVLKRHEELLGLDESLQCYVVLKKLPLYVVESFYPYSPYSKEEQKVLFSFIQGRHLTVSQLKECLVWIREIMVRDKISIEDILASLSSRESIEEIRRGLKLKRYPKLSELEKQFKEYKQSLALPLEAPSFFEEDKIYLKFGFSNKQELEVWRQKIDRALDRKELEEMLKLL